MAEGVETLIFTPEHGVSTASAIAALRRNGVGDIVELKEVGLIVGKAPAAALPALRALAELRGAERDLPFSVPDIPRE